MKGLLLFGNEEQKSRYLPRLATGELVAAFALTEPGAGSDAAAIQTRAEQLPVRRLPVNGAKIWITNGGFADVFTVFARTSAPHESAKPRITAFLVERGKGVTTGPNERKLGIRGCSTTEVFFDDVVVPAANVLGEVGRGFKVAMEVLNSGRLGLASGCVGQARHLIQLATERVQERKAFGRNIGEFGLIKDKIAHMLSETYALESMTYMTTAMVDAKISDYSIESAICKVYGSETLWRVANETLQIAAGVGYMDDYPYERLLRDARINLIFEGTNEILRCFIALSGMQGPGNELVEVARAMREPIKGFGLLSDFAIRKAAPCLGSRAAHEARTRSSTARPSSSRSTPRARAQRRQGAAQARQEHRRDAVHAAARRRHGDRPLRRRVRARADDAGHRAARRRGRAPRDRPHDDVRLLAQSGASRRTSPRSRRTTTSSGRPSPTRPTSTAATPSTSYEPSAGTLSPLGARSTVKRNVVPSPTLLSTPTVPPSASTRCLTIDESETCPTELARAAGVDAVEALEEPRQVPLGDARPGVRDGDPEHLALLAARETTTRAPSGEYLMALSMRFVSTCSSARRSTRALGSVSGTSAERRMRLLPSALAQEVEHLGDDRPRARRPPC